jgi:hypothetical protein
LTHSKDSTSHYNPLRKKLVLFQKWQNEWAKFEWHKKIVTPTNKKDNGLHKSSKGRSNQTIHKKEEKK